MPKTTRGNQYILSIHDDLTKYLVLVPLKTQRTESLHHYYINIFSVPKTILTEQVLTKLYQRTNGKIRRSI